MTHKARMTAEIPSVMSYLQNAHPFFKVVILIFFSLSVISMTTNCYTQKILRSLAKTLSGLTGRQDSQTYLEENTK